MTTTGTSLSETIDLLHRRSSVRAFTGEPVPTAVLDELLGAAVRAPTSFNLQAYSLVVVGDPARRTLLAELVGQPHVAEAPVTVVVCMCRIFGYLGRTPGPDWLDETGALLRHGGPDGFGRIAGPEWGLGATRLAITDPNGGRQPYRLTGAPDEIRAVFQRRALQPRRASRRPAAGRLPLRRPLRRLDHPGALPPVRAGLPRPPRRHVRDPLLDLRARPTLLLATDDTGIKPLYYSVDSDRGICFASEIPALLTFPGVGRDPWVEGLDAPGTFVDATRSMAVDGRYLLPGLIDSHVHFRDPGLTHKEDWAHGSRAAVAGGVTTVIDMPNTRPPLTTPEDAWSRHRTVDGTSLVDYRFHAGVAGADLGRIKAFSPREAGSVKVFLSGHHTAPDTVHDPVVLDRLCAIVAERQLTLVCHAEHDGVFALLDTWRGEPRTPRDFEAHRPRTAAIVAVANLIELARRHGTRIHVLHVSSREEADLLTAAAASGLPVSFEVTGHHLTFTNDDIDRLGTLIRLRPAIREPGDRDRLWQAVLAGHASTAGSDHAPHTLAEKSLPAGQAPPGLPGGQELFPALYTGLLARQPGSGPADLLPIVVRLLAVGPARLFDLAERKGAIEPGRDADIVVFDPYRRRTFGAADVHAKCGWSAYQGMTFQGGIDLTLRRGALAYRWTPDGETFGEPDGIWLVSAARSPS